MQLAKFQPVKPVFRYVVGGVGLSKPDTSFYFTVKRQLKYTGNCLKEV